MKKLYVLLFFLPVLCTATVEDSNLELELKNLKQQVVDITTQMHTISESIDLLCEKLQNSESENKNDIANSKSINSVKEKSNKKSKISWGKRLDLKEKAVEKKLVNKKNDAIDTEEENSIVDADDNQGGD